MTLVVLGAEASDVEREVELGGVTVVHCADWERGQGASLRAGLAQLARGSERHDTPQQLAALEKRRTEAA